MRFLQFYFVFVIFIVSIEKKIWGANVLYMSVIPALSHTMWDKTLAIALRDKGHNITFVTPGFEKTEENFTVIFLEDVYIKVLKTFDLKEILHYTATENVAFLFDWVYESCKQGIQTQGFQKLLSLDKQENKFDLIILDISSGICFLPIVELFNYPNLIATTPFGIQPYVGDNFGVNSHISYLPHYALSYSQNMNFLQRLHNLYVHVYDFWATWDFYRKCKNIIDEFYGRDMSHVFDIQKNFSFLFANYDPVLDSPRTLPPDVIPVGGLHIKQVKPLPQELQDFMDNSRNGVIIFSLGTSIHGVHLGQNKTKLFIEAFSQLKQNILWKYETGIADLPKNVLIRKYLPQNDLLAHPNTKLLINHGGSLTIQEAIYHGVPLVVMPFCVDQYVNSQGIVHRGLGAKLSFKDLTSDYIVSTINEVIRNPLYKQNSKHLSAIYRDKASTPLERAVFWVEYLLRRQEAKVFRTPGRRATFFQNNLLDLWGFFIATIFIIYIICIKTCRIVNNKKIKEKSQ